MEQEQDDLQNEQQDNDNQGATDKKRPSPASQAMRSMPLALKLKIYFWVAVIVGAIAAFIYLLALIAVIASTGNGPEEEPDTQFGSCIYTGGNENVLAWHDDVERYVMQYGESWMTPWMLAVMHMESGGLGGDPMQSSESRGWAPNTITDPLESIRYGIIHFNNVMRNLRNLQIYNPSGDLDFMAALQSYNFGSGYLGYLHSNDSHHNIDNSESFSIQLAIDLAGEALQVVYTSGTHGRLWRWQNGGNFHYAYRLYGLVHCDDGPLGDIVSGEFIRPLRTGLVTPAGEWRTSSRPGHTGMDLQNPRPLGSGGSTGVGDHVLAVGDGRVTFVGYNANGYGHWIRISHIIDGQEFTTVYAHLRERPNLTVGQAVSQGQIIGFTGRSGRVESMGHLHFEIIRGSWRGAGLNDINPRNMISFPPAGMRW